VHVVGLPVELPRVRLEVGADLPHHPLAVLEHIVVEGAAPGTW
jgi:hypothetical protein